MKFNIKPIISGISGSDTHLVIPESMKEYIDYTQAIKNQGAYFKNEVWFNSDGSYLADTPQEGCKSLDLQLHQIPRYDVKDYWLITSDETPIQKGSVIRVKPLTSELKLVIEYDTQSELAFEPPVDGFDDESLPNDND